MLIKKIKNYLKINKELKSYHFGDIIWCYVDSYADFNFVQKHQIRPFLFLKYKSGKIYGYTMTHSIPKKKELHYQFTKLNDGNFVILSCVFNIKKKNYKGYMGKMLISDCSNVAKIIYNMQDNNEVKNDIIKKITIEENDIVLFNCNKYFVYARDNNQLTLYKISNNQDDIYFNTSDKGQMYIEAKPLIAKADSVIYLDTFKDYLVPLFKEKRKCFKPVNKENKTNLIIGDLFKTSSGTYAVYKIYNDSMDVINIYSKNPKITNRPLSKYKKSGTVSFQRLNKVANLALEFEKKFNL